MIDWREAILQRDSVKKTLSDPEHYVEIYDRYLKNEAQSEMAKGTRGGTVSTAHRSCACLADFVRLQGEP